MTLARNHFGEIQNYNASFLSVLRNVVWIGPSPKEWLFWPLLYLPVCLNPISCQSYVKIDMRDNKAGGAGDHLHPFLHKFGHFFCFTAKAQKTLETDPRSHNVHPNALSLT